MNNPHQERKEQGKPRLVIATDSFLPRWDGIARFLSAVIPGLTQRFQITIIAPDNGPVEMPGCKIVKIPLRKIYLGDFKPAKFRYRRIRREVRKADVVFVQSSGPIGALAILAARSCHRPIACFIHNLEAVLFPMAVGPGPLRKLLFPFMRWYTRFLYNRSSLLITPSEWVSDQLFWNRITRVKRVVRLGVDTAKFTPGKSPGLRASLGIKEDDFVIGQHGRLAHEKDLRTLLRGFIRLRANNKKAKLLIIGEGVPSIKRMLQAQEGVILAGKQDNVIPYIRVMDVFALTSMIETTCLAALEAMSCALPVVSTPVGFVKYYVKDGENGFFVPFNNPIELKQKLELLQQNPSLRERLGEAARKTVMDEFDWDQTIKGVEAALLETMER